MSNVSDTLPVILTGVFGQYFVYGTESERFKVFHRPHGIPDTGDEFSWSLSDVHQVVMWSVERIDPDTGDTLVALSSVGGFDVYLTPSIYTIAATAYAEHRVKGKLIAKDISKEDMWKMFGVSM